MLSLDQEPAPAWLKNPRFLAQTVSRRQADSVASGASRTPVARHRSGRAVVRRAVVGRLRNRLHPRHAGRRGRRRALVYAIPISLVIATLLAIVAFSYRQTIHAYPTGGGAYIVAKENIGPTAGLIAAASLLVDYTLTVAVSISAGVLAITSAFPQPRSLPRRDVPRLPRHADGRQPARHPRVGTASSRCRPISSSSASSLLLAAGLYRYLTGGIVPVEAPLPADAGDAAADDVPAADGVRQRLHGDDRRRGGVERRAGVPSARGEERVGDARRDGGAGDRDVRRHHRAGARLPGDAERRPSRACRSWAARSSAARTSVYYLLQAATTLILVLAANTAYADFPRLASIVSRDGYLPRQFMNQGDRLAFSNGILVLSALRRDPDRRVPRRHAVAAAALHDRRVHLVHAVAGRHGDPLAEDAASPGWKTSALINGFGALVTGVVLIIVAVTKTLEGAWIVLLLIPIIVDAVQGDAPPLRSRRRRADAEAATRRSARVHNTVLIPIGGLQRAVVEALRYAETLSDDVRAVYVDVESGGNRTGAEGLGHVGRTRAAGRAAVAVPIADGAAARVHRAGRERAAERLRDGHPAGVRAGALVAAPAAQPDVAAHQGWARSGRRCRRSALLSALSPSSHPSHHQHPPEPL